MKRLLLIITLGLSFVLSTLGANSIYQTYAGGRQGIDFSVGNQGLSTGTSFIESPNTFEAWIKLAPEARISPLGSGRFGVIVGSYISNNAAGSINFEIGASGNPRFYWGGTTTNFTSVDVRTGEWMHLAIVRNQSSQQLHLYVDGILTESISRDSPDIIASNVIWIGQDSRSTSYFMGTIHSVVISSSIKDGAAISQSMITIPSRLEPNVLISEILDYSPIPVYENNRTTYVADNFMRPINTFSAWIKLPTLFHDQAVGGILFGNYINRLSVDSINFEIWTHGNFRIFWNRGEFAYVFKSVDLRTDDWEHIALTRDPVTNTFSLYHNGIYKESATFPTTWSNGNLTPYNIGNDSRGSEVVNKYPFFGEIRQITLYDSPKAQATIAEDMSSSSITVKNRDESLIANWNFENWFAKEAVLSDSSGNDNNLILGSYDLFVTDIEQYEDFDYTIAIIPDTQTMTSFNPGLFNGMTKWMADNAEEQKIAFAMHLGDLTNAATTNHYNVASQAMYRLDGKIPYTFVLGNHDYDNMINIDRSTTNFNIAFPYEKYSNYSWFGGAYEEGSMDNYYAVFEIGAVKYLVFALEVGPRTSVLQWANRVALEFGSEYRIIVTTHSYMNPYGRLTTPGDESVISYGFATNYGHEVNDGQQMFDKFVSQHPSMLFTFNGHHTYDYIVKREDVGINGNKIMSMLIDGQAVMTSEMGSKTHAEDLIMLMRMNESKKEAYCYYYSPARNAYYNYQNQFVFSFSDENNPALNTVIQSETPIYVDTSTPTITINVSEQMVIVPTFAIIILAVSGGILLAGQVGLFIFLRKSKNKKRR